MVLSFYIQLLSWATFLKIPNTYEVSRQYKTTGKIIYFDIVTFMSILFFTFLIAGGNTKDSKLNYINHSPCLMRPWLYLESSFVLLQLFRKKWNFPHFQRTGVCVTNERSFVFGDRIYWTFTQLVTTVHKSLFDTLSSSSDWTFHGR
jgi:hypothetical protein